MKHRFATLDVFTANRFAGNPLAVVFDADTIDPARMQAIAREFNHPETVFVLKPQHPANAARLRIFTPAIELPFAGHPTVGTAALLALRSGGGAQKLVLEEQIGLIRCTVTPGGDDRAHAAFDLPELPQEAGDAADASAIADALGLAASDIGAGEWRPERWSAGIVFTVVPVRDLDTVRRARPDLARWDAAFEAGGRSSAYIVCRETVEPDSSVHVRMFAPRMGVSEDPATGSAAAAFAGPYARAMQPADGTHRVIIEQGYEIGRPSRIELTIAMQDGKLASASIGGEAIVVTEGTIEV